MSALEDRLLAKLRAAGVETPERERALIPGRRFRADFCWPRAALVVEVQGGVFDGGRHVTGAGYARDCEKLALLTLAGWRVLFVAPPQIRSGEAVRWIRTALAQEPGWNLQAAS